MDGGRVPFLFVNFCQTGSAVGERRQVAWRRLLQLSFQKTAIESFTDITYFVSFFYTWPSVVEFNGKAVETVDIATLKYNPNR